MKKFFAVIVGLLLTIGCFADSVWNFKSCDSSIGYKPFISAEVRNYSGRRITVNGDTVFNGSYRAFFDNYIIIESDSAGKLNAYYKVASGKLYVTITRN